MMKARIGSHFGEATISLCKAATLIEDDERRRVRIRRRIRAEEKDEEEDDEEQKGESTLRIL